MEQKFERKKQATKADDDFLVLKDDGLSVEKSNEQIEKRFLKMESLGIPLKFHKGDGITSDSGPLESVVEELKLLYDLITGAFHPYKGPVMEEFQRG